MCIRDSSRSEPQSLIEGVVHTCIRLRNDTGDTVAVLSDQRNGGIVGAAVNYNVLYGRVVLGGDRLQRRDDRLPAIVYRGNDRDSRDAHRAAPGKRNVSIA